MSAARLAAEAAFGPAPVAPPPLPAAPIIVRRSRLRESTHMETGPGASPGADAGPGAQRAPRVFRIPAAAPAGADEPATAAPQTPLSPAAGAELPVVPRSERIGHDRRSRLIRHIAVRSAESPADPPAVTPAVPAAFDLQAALPGQPPQRSDPARASALAADLSAALQRLREVEALFAQLEALKGELALIHSARTFTALRR